MAADEDDDDFDGDDNKDDDDDDDLKQGGSCSDTMLSSTPTNHVGVLTHEMLSEVIGMIIYIG